MPHTSATPQCQGRGKWFGGFRDEVGLNSSGLLRDLQEPLGHCQAGRAPHLPFLPWCVHLLDQSTSEALVQSGQEGLAVAEGSLPAIFPSSQKSGWKGVFQREGLWLWPSSSLAVVTVLWNTPNFHPLSALTSLHHLQKQALTPCGNRGCHPKKHNFLITEGTSHVISALHHVKIIQIAH